MTLVVSSGSGSLSMSVALWEVSAAMRLFFRTFRRAMDAADNPEASLVLEEDSWPEEKRWDAVVAAWEMWSLKKPQVDMMVSSRTVRGRASAPLFISVALILPEAVLFCSKYFRH